MGGLAFSPAGMCARPPIDRHKAQSFIRPAHLNDGVTDHHSITPDRTTYMQLPLSPCRETVFPAETEIFTPAFSACSRNGTFKLQRKAPARTNR